MNSKQPALSPAPPEGETGYRWLFTSRHPSWFSWGVAGAAVCAVCAVYSWYLRAGGPPSPAGPLGFAYALVGLGSFLCALLLYRAYRNARASSRPGQLHTHLQWHSRFAIASAVLLALHSFGKLTPYRSGTYALYGLLLVLASGVVGRVIDHLVPRLIALEAARALGRHASSALPRSSQPLRMAESLDRVSLYRRVIRCWRTVHGALAVLACILVAWHLLSVLALYYVFPREHLALPFLLA